MRGPLIVWALGGLIVASFIVSGQYAPFANQAVFERFAVVPARFTGADARLEDLAVPLLGHVFVHFGVFHLLMNALAYAQSAPFVAFRLGSARFLLLFFISALGGAAAFVLIHPASEVGAVGASGAICGLFGAYFLAVRPSPRAALADPQVRNAMLSFLAINVVLVALLPLPIAWEAHLGGFFAGALAYLALAPQRRVVGPWD